VRTPLSPLIPISNPDPSERQHNNHPTRSNSQCHFRLVAVAPPEGGMGGEASPYGWTSKNYVICVCFHRHGTSSASKCVSFWRTSYSRPPIDPYLTSPPCYKILATALPPRHRCGVAVVVAIRSAIALPKPLYKHCQSRQSRDVPRGRPHLKPTCQTPIHLYASETRFDRRHVKASVCWQVDIFVAVTDPIFSLSESSSE